MYENLYEQGSRRWMTAEREGKKWQAFGKNRKIAGEKNKP